MDGSFVVFLLVICPVLALVCMVAALRDGKRKRLVDNLPTCKTTGVFIGLVELKGTAESGAPLTSYLAEHPCVHYSWCIEESWTRTVTETYTDNEGRLQTRTRTESGWETVGSGGDAQSFYLQDDCGLVLVRPNGAKIEPTNMVHEICDPGDPLYYGKGPSGSVSGSDFRRRFVENGIPLHQKLYLMGQAREREDMVAAEITADTNAPMFLISTRSEEQVSSGLGWGFWGWMICGAAFAGGEGMLLSRGALPFCVAGAVAYFILFQLGWLWMVYNSMVDLRQRVRSAWSQVDVQLRRRHDLIPNLVSAVQGYRDHENTVQTELAAMRSQLTATPPGVAGPDYQAVSRQVIAIVERYPELKANETFSNLQQELIDTEQRITLARGYFNDIATFYNTRLEKVPDRYVASLGGMKEQPLMQANDFERAPVEVKLAVAS